MKKKTLLFSGILLLIAMMLLGGCNSQASGDEKEPIIFADENWASLRFHNEIAGTIIEAGYGYETEQRKGSASALLTGLREGDIDVHMEIWKQNNIETYNDGIESGDFVKLSVNFDDNYQGLYVPTYVIEGDPERGIEPMAPNLKYIPDLADYEDLFQDPGDKENGRIIGAIPGWEVSELTFETMKEYGLDEQFNYFRPGSEAAINTSLADAYKNGEPWVGYNYEPNWVMGKYDMTPLLEKKDTPLSTVATQNVEIVSHKSLPERAPEVTEFLKNYQTTSEIANNALDYMQNEDASAHEAAIKFLKEEEALWTEWVPEEVATKVKEAIE
ncbi:ABC transporter substrate-binding protein [Lentibacillus juripiscarius]|uniref:ABC transporter substrate-binding protein n=1 Tax=Lentibacillus juripiscarius TaxID=257446 RepID=A0ABW5V9M9_9BACI